MPIGNEGGAADFFADLDAEAGDRLVADETDRRCNHHRPKMLYRLRVEETIDRFIAGNNSAQQDRKHDCNARQVFDPSVAVSESFVGFPSREPEGNPERDGGRGVTDIMNRVGKERHTARKYDDDNLENGGCEQTRKRPFDGPYSPFRGDDGWVNNTVCMGMAGMSVAMLMMMFVMMSILMICHLYVPRSGGDAHRFIEK